MNYRYIIPAIPPSLNIFAGRQNVQEYRKLKRDWKMIVRASCHERPKTPIEKAVIKLMYFFPTRARHDPDNYAGKMILDGLTAAGIIKDDSFEHISLALYGAYDKHNPRVEISITEVSDGQQDKN